MTRLGATVLALALSLPGYATAQIAHSSMEFAPDRHKDSKELGARQLKETVACTLTRTQAPFDRLLAARPASRDEQRSSRAIANWAEKCFGNKLPALSFSPAELRGFTAELYYLRDYPADPDFARLDHKEQPLPANWLAAKPDQAEGTALYSHQFASCVVAADPKASAALLRTEVRGADERAAAKALAPQLGACLDSNRKLRIDAAMLRALLAEQLYRAVKIWRPVA